MKNINNAINIIRSSNGGATVYVCPWNDYRSTSFAKTWAHAIVHAAKKGWFSLPFQMIKTALGF